MGLIDGLGTLLTLVGHISQALWVGKSPYFYQYILPAMLGLSLHYTVGSFLGRDRSENMVGTMLKASQGKRVIRGTISIQGASADNKRKTRWRPTPFSFQECRLETDLSESNAG